MIVIIWITLTKEMSIEKQTVDDVDSRFHQGQATTTNYTHHKFHCRDGLSKKNLTSRLCKFYKTLSFCVKSLDCDIKAGDRFQ